MKPFEQVVVDHGPTILRVCRAVLGSVDAADAWSETFLAALRAYPRLEAGANVEAWLVTIAHRKAIDVIRARARQPVPIGERIEPAPVVIPAEEWELDLRDAVQALPAKQRQAVAYHYLGGLPHAQTAELIGGTADAARRAAADGIRNLRKTYSAGRLSSAPRTKREPTDPNGRTAHDHHDTL
jgi:RNA polymerase sigma factor (sigma-70 family)